MGIDERMAGTQGACHDPPLSVERLGAGMHHHVGAQGERLLQHRSCKAVVHGQQRTCRVGHIGKGTDVAQIGERIGGSFGKQQPGVGAHGSTPCLHVGLGNEGGFHPEASHFGTHELDGGTEHGLGTDDMVTGLEQAKGEQQHGGHAARRGNGCLGPFKRGEALLEAGHGRIACPSIGVAIARMGEVVRRRFGIGLHEAAGEVERLAVFAVLAARDGLPYRQGLGVPAVRVGGGSGFVRKGVDAGRVGCACGGSHDRIEGITPVPRHSGGRGGRCFRCPRTIWVARPACG